MFFDDFKWLQQIIMRERKKRFFFRSSIECGCFSCRGMCCAMMRGRGFFFKDFLLPLALGDFVFYFEA